MVPLGAFVWAWCNIAAMPATATGI